MTDTPPADPQPPYDGYAVPERFREVAYADLPPAIKAKLAAQAPPVVATKQGEGA
jgi:hypothetical protein